MTDAHPYRMIPAERAPYEARTHRDRLDVSIHPDAPSQIRAFVPETLLCLPLLYACMESHPLYAAAIAVVTLVSTTLRARSALRNMQPRLAFDRRSLRVARPFEYWASTRCETKDIREFVADGERLVVLRVDGAALSLPTTGLVADETAALASLLERHRRGLAA